MDSRLLVFPSIGFYNEPVFAGNNIGSNPKTPKIGQPLGFS